MGSEQAHAINNNMTHIPGHRHAALTPPHTPATTAPAVDAEARPRRRRARRPHLRRSLARPLPAAAHRRPLRHAGQMPAANGRAGACLGGSERLEVDASL